MGTSVIELLKERWLSDKFVAGLLRSLSQAKPDALAWMAWEKSGRPPFTREGWGIKRNSSRINWNKANGGFPRLVSDSDRNLKDARSELEKAQAVVAEAQAKVDLYEAEQLTVLQEQLIVSLRLQIAEILMFGPAWELMRIVGPQLPLSQREAAEFKAVARGKTDVEKERGAEALRIGQTIDAFAGNEAFDEELRGAIKDVCEKFRAANPGRVNRVATKMRESVRREEAFDPVALIESYQQMEAEDGEAAVSALDQTDREAMDAIVEAMEQRTMSETGATFAPVERIATLLAIAGALDKARPRADGVTRVGALKVS